MRLIVEELGVSNYMAAGPPIYLIFYIVMDTALKLVWKWCQKIVWEHPYTTLQNDTNL